MTLRDVLAGRSGNVKIMKRYLLAESRRVHKICHENSRYAGNGA